MKQESIEILAKTRPVPKPTGLAPAAAHPPRAKMPAVNWTKKKKRRANLVADATRPLKPHRSKLPAVNYPG